MFHIQYIPKLIICNSSFRSSDTKQWHTLWIRKLSFKRVTDNISSIYHGLYLHHKCREFFSTDYPVSAVKIFGTGIKDMGVWCIVPYQDLLKVSQKANFGCHSHGSMKQGAVSIRKTVLPGMVIPMLKIRRPDGRLIFNMEIAIRR